MRPLASALSRLRARMLISSLALWERVRVRALKEALPSLIFFK